MDHIPVAIADEASLNYVHADDLGTPRAISNSQQERVWAWRLSGNPFGENPPTSGPGYTFNLRFPGQYFDSDSSLNYNYQRNYDSTAGRYVQSDPIGLNDSTSTYAYVGSNPLTFSDPTGTQVALPWVEPWVGGAPTGAIDVMPWVESRARGKTDPLQDLSPINPGRDCDGNCKPCPPGSSWAAPGSEHGSTNGWHWHWIEYNQNKNNCICYPYRRSSANQPPNVPVHPLSPLQTIPVI